MIKTKITLIVGLLFSASASAANLLEIYRDALQSDPLYQQALAQQLSTSEGVPILSLIHI